MYCYIHRGAHNSDGKKHETVQCSARTKNGIRCTTKYSAEVDRVYCRVHSVPPVRLSHQELYGVLQEIRDLQSRPMTPLSCRIVAEFATGCVSSCCLCNRDIYFSPAHVRDVRGIYMHMYLDPNADSQRIAYSPFDTIRHPKEKRGQYIYDWWSRIGYCSTCTRSDTKRITFGKVQSERCACGDH